MPTVNHNGILFGCPVNLEQNLALFYFVIIRYISGHA